MTTAKPAVLTQDSRGKFRLPDAPEREPDEKMTNFDHLHRLGNAHHLAQHLGNPETTLVEADRWIIAAPGTYKELARYPDLLIAFGVDPALYEADNGYIISKQGKAPDFVLEVASWSTADVDVSAKRVDYEALGIGEYWRFDRDPGNSMGRGLPGDRLVNGRYEPIDIEELEDGALQGFSAALNLHLRWGEWAIGMVRP